MDQNWKLIADKLPKQPSDELAADTMSEIYDEGLLGENLILYHRESVLAAPLLERTMCPEDWERRERMSKRRWGARCTCSYCGEDFIAGYVSRGRGRGIALFEGDDGQIYDGFTTADDGGTEFFDGDSLQCPLCYMTGVVTHRAELRNGRTHQALQAEVVNVDSYTAVMYWLFSRRQDDAGSDVVLVRPHAALLVDAAGKLRRFRVQRTGAEVTDVLWVPCAKSRDPMQVPYYSWEAANCRKIGGWTFTYGPPMDGHTGEKTALDKYIGSGGCWPGAYLHVWQRRPQVENLMRHGFAQAVVSTIDRALDQAAYWRDLCDAPPISWVDWSEVKPHRMLGMSKTAFREISKLGWSDTDALCWAKYRRILANADALEFESCRQKISSHGIDQLLDMVNAGWDDLAPVRVARYLERQALLHEGVQLLIDYRKMMQDVGVPETSETLWPKNLLDAHERLVQSWAACHESRYELGFTSTYIQYKDLEWSDGDLCVVLPKGAQELVEEGNTLRHCVGGYAKDHCSGLPVFFVRHYRRPERSYYTLQINMTGNAPKEIQLHGYGNERHGVNKEYTHTIPRKVREFCDRWERDVLQPWFAARRNAKKQRVFKRKVA